jgi:hypothetical protein
LGNGITNVIIIPSSDTRISLATLVLTYDNSTVTCIKLSADIMHKTAKYSTDIYQTLWTMKQQSTSINSSYQVNNSINNCSSSSDTIRLLAVSTYTFSDNWCIVTVQHRSNDVEISQADSHGTIKQLAYIKGPATTESTTDVIGAIAVQRSDHMKLQLIVAYKHTVTQCSLQVHCCLV